MRRSKSSRPGALFRPLVGPLVGLLLLGVSGASFLAPAHAQSERGASSAASSQLGITAPANDPCFLDVLCKGHYQRARLFSKAGELESALTEYQIAFKQQPVPWLLLNIARTLHKIPRLPEAIEKYQRYLDMTQQSGDAELRGKAQEYLEQAKKELAERPPPEKEPPPAPLVAAPAVTSPPIGLVEQKVERPIYKKWWFWTIIGVSAAAVAGGIAGGVLASQRAPAVPTVPTEADAYRPMF
jgi:tetratricopeptide (TPR) repeat protein